MAENINSVELFEQEVRGRNFVDEVERKAAEADMRRVKIEERYAALRSRGGDSRVAAYHAEMEAAAAREAMRERNALIDTIRESQINAAVAELASTMPSFIFGGFRHSVPPPQQAPPPLRASAPDFQRSGGPGNIEDFDEDLARAISLSLSEGASGVAHTTDVGPVTRTSDGSHARELEAALALGTAESAARARAPASASSLYS